MDIDSLAQALFGSKRAETQEVSTDGTTRTYTGVALTDSEDGTVVIDLGGDVTLPDDLYDEGGNVVAEWDGVGVEMPTSPQVSAGDDVIVTLMGGSATKTPMVTSSAGSGDRMRALVNAAQTVADAAQAVAEAVNQHFFSDTNGIHVTEVTQEEWDESPTGANVLINSIGQLFRDGLNNLLALLASSVATEYFTVGDYDEYQTYYPTGQVQTILSVKAGGVEVPKYVDGTSSDSAYYTDNGTYISLSLEAETQYAGEPLEITYLTPSAMAFFDGLGNDASNVIASFSSLGATIGYEGSGHTVVDALGVHAYDADGTEVALFAATPRIGETDGYNVTIEPSSIDFNKGTSKVYGITAYAETVDGEYTTVTTNRGTLEYGADGGAFVEGEEAHFFEKDGSSESWDSKLTLKALDNHRPDGESEAPWHDPLIELRVNRSTSSGGSSVTSYATIMSETWVVWDLQNTAQGHIDRRNYIIDSHDAAISLRSPIGTYTGTSSTATASASGWQLTYFNTVVAEVGSPKVHDYHFTNGVLTATRDCVLEISGVMNWTDALAGNRGFGIFEGTTVGSGTEASSFQNFPSGVSNRKSVVFPPKLFTLSAGDSLTFGRYQQANAVYQNGTNYSWVTIRVVG